MKQFLLIIGLLSFIIKGKSPPYDGKVRYYDNGAYMAYMIPQGHANHASFLEKLPDGSLVIAWFTGAHEAANNVSIAFSKLAQNSDQWTTPKLISRRSNFSNQNPVLFYDSTTSILHCFHSQEPAQNQSANYNESEAQIWHLQSSDFGDTWTTSKALFSAPGAFPRNRIIESLDGGLLFPIYNASKNYPLIARASAECRLNLGNRSCWTLDIIENSGNHLVQPSIFRMALSYPNLKAYFRDRQQIGIYEAVSSDDGKTWTKPNSFQLPNPNVAIQANILYVNESNGSLVLMFNDYNGDNKLGRTPLSIALSYDDGIHFPNVKMIQVHNDNETVINGSCSYSYPSILQTNDGWIHCCYTYDSRYTQATIKYMRFNYSWLLYG